MEKRSSSRSRSRSAERNQASSYANGGLSPPCNTKSDPLSAYRQRLVSNERDPLICQGQESSRRYAAFLQQDGLLPLDTNLNNDARNEYSLEFDNSQISTRRESPIDLIATERLVPVKERRPASTPAAAFQLPSSRSHPGPRHSNACNFNINLGNLAAGKKPSTTSIEDEAEADEFQNDLTEVTNQLELIQETQGSILTDLSNDILALQMENASLKESKDRLQSTNDNLMKVVHDLTKECTRLKMQHSSTASVSKVTRLHKPSEEIHGVGATLSKSHHSNQQILKAQIPNGTKSGRKDIKPKVKEENQIRRSQSGRTVLVSNSRTSYSRDDLRHAKPGYSRDDLRNTKPGYNRDDITPPPHHHLKLSHSRENNPHHKSKSHNRPSCEKHGEKARSHRSEPPPREENRLSSSSKPKHRKNSSNNAGHEQERSDRQHKRYESTVENEDSDSDEGRPINRGEKRKKKKRGCFSFMRRRSYHDEDHIRERD